MDSGFGNSIYWTLPVMTTIIHFTTLQHINRRHYVFWVRYSVMPFLADESSLLSSWLHADLWTPELSFVSCCLYLSVSSVSPSWIEQGTPYRRVRLSCKTISVATRITAFLVVNNGEASVRCLGNDFSVPSFRHFATLSPKRRLTLNGFCGVISQKINL
jgi:hypothetical protein